MAVKMERDFCHIKPGGKCQTIEVFHIKKPLLEDEAGGADKSVNQRMEDKGIIRTG
jgi:hypothetical protein